MFSKRLTKTFIAIQISTVDRTTSGLIKFVKHWPVCLVCIGLLLIVLSFSADAFSVSPGFGVRQQRVLFLGAVIGLLGVMILALPGLRAKIEALFQRLYTWFGSGQGNRRAWLLAIVFTLVLFGLFLVFFNKRYDYIDDPPIRDSVKQNIALLFSANVLRQVLHALYQFLPNLPWYGIALYVSMVASLVIIVMIIITQKKPTWFKLLVLALIVSLFIPFWMRASYNYASSIPGALAFILLFISARKGSLRPFHAFLLGLLLVISFVYRRDGVKVGLVFIAPPVLALMFLQWVIEKTPLKRWAMYGVALTLFALPYLLVQVFDEYQYREVLTPAEQFHRTSNRSRSAYYGQPLLLSKILQDRDLLAANGWNENDMIIAEYGMVMFDENKYAAERFFTIFNPQIGLTEEENPRGINGLLDNLTHFGQLENFEWYNPGWIKFNETWPYWPYYAAMVTLAVLSIWRGKRFYHKLFGPMFLVYFYLISTYMENYMRFPRHVAVPPMVITCLALYVCVEFDFQKITHGWHRKLLAGLVLAGVILSMVGLAKLDWDTDQEIVVKRDKYFTLYQDLEKRLGKDAFIFVRAPLYLDYFVDPLGDQGPENQISFLNVSSTAYSPAFYQLIGKYGLARGYQVLPWMVDNPDAYFISGQKFLVDRLRRFIVETYGIQADFQTVHVYPDGLTVYRLVKRDDAPAHFHVVTSLLDALPTAKIQPLDETHIYETQITINGETRDAIFAHPESEIIYPIRVPAAGILRFGMGFTPEAWLGEAPVGDGVQFDVYIQDGSQRQQIFSRYLDPKNNRDERTWQDVEVGLRQWAGEDVQLVLATGAGPQQDATNDWAAWSEPLIGEWVYFNFCQKFYLASPPPVSLDLLRVRRILVNDQYQDGIYQHPTSLLTYPVKVESGSTMQFSVGIDPAGWVGGQGDGARFDILVANADGSYHRVYSRYINPAHVMEDRQWFDESVDFSAYGGQEVEITLAVFAGPAGDTSYDWAYWVNPRLVMTGTDH